MRPELEGPMTLLAEAAAPLTAHVESTSRRLAPQYSTRRGSRAVPGRHPPPGRRPLLAAAWLRVTWAHVGARLTAVSLSSRGLFCGASLILLCLPLIGLAYHVFFDRSGLPDIEPFIRFTPPAIGEVYDARGTVLIRLAREYRRVVSYDEVPPVLRHAILSAEDKHFFTHSGVDYRAWPRVLQKTVARLAGHVGSRRRRAPDARFGHGGSTLTQQLVRGYFLQNLTCREDAADVLSRGGPTPRLLSTASGRSRHQQLLRKVEEIRLALWLEAEMRRRLRLRRSAPSARSSRATASFIYLGHGRYGFAAGSDYYFGKPLSSYGPEDVGQAAVLAGIMQIASRLRPGARETRDRCAAATRSWP